MTEVTSLQGPIELVDGELIIRIPIAVGGDKLAPMASGIGQLQGDFLVVVIEQWLADKLGIAEGSNVVVDNRNGKFNITPVE